MSGNQKNFVVNLNVCEIQKKDIEKVEILFDLNGKSYQLKDKTYDKCVACLNGYCTVIDIENKETATIDRPDMNVEVAKNTNLEIVNYSKNARIIITYYKDQDDE